MTSSCNRIDGVSADAPELAGYGSLAVGVRTEALSYRGLVIEVWYPAEYDSALTSSDGVYDTLLRDGETPIRLHGRAQRDARALAGDWPLVILSHGYPGNRLLMAHLGESLSSRGYLVASVDHTLSTYADKGDFLVTLVNRPLDTRWVADHLRAKDYAIIGYSMGGYGALVSGGAAVSASAVADYGAALEVHRSVTVDPRLRAIIPIGPWGRQKGVWDAAGLSKLAVPALIMAGSADDVSGYVTGMRLIHQQAPDTLLLTFEGAGHNAAAPFPAPKEAFTPSARMDFLPAEHYADPVWDTVRMNGIAQHFAVAFLGLHLKREAEMARYLTPEFAGFAAGAAEGLRLERD
ncbi:MAG: alpha/beta hydrolase family protein [Cypionkella sp.]